jgi:hypothetical protein
MIPERCTFCKKPSVESLEFEAGNNAETAVWVELCQKHFDEYDKDEWAFQDKHCDKLNDMAGQVLINEVDALIDRAKYE